MDFDELLGGIASILSVALIFIGFCVEGLSFIINIDAILRTGIVLIISGFSLWSVLMLTSKRNNY